MINIELLLHFEEKYPFLYDIQANGIPIYAGIRDGVANCFRQKFETRNSVYQEEKGHIYVRRIVDSAFKLVAFRKAKTLVFTSSMYQRDHGKNLAAEYLLEKYPDAYIFEWPSKNAIYDKAYLNNSKKYCPIDFYLFLYKIYVKLHKKKVRRLEKYCFDLIQDKFVGTKSNTTLQEENAIKYILNELPNSYATTVLSQELFQKLFRKYKNVKYAIDFWGGARENIIPILPGNPESIELQHGIITSVHPGYIYPQYVSEKAKGFFGRTILVYGENTKKLLVKNSIFKENQIEVIGNPRIYMYQKNFSMKQNEKKLILFTSQPIEQDNNGTGYYDRVVFLLKDIVVSLKSELKNHDIVLGIKLHPRENNGVKEIYQNRIPGCVVFDNTKELYELFSMSLLHFTVSSTTLYEAALFEVPTVLLSYNNIDPKEIYGFDVSTIDKKNDLAYIVDLLKDNQKYEKYLSFLKENTMRYM